MMGFFGAADVTLPKKDPKIYESRDRPLGLCSNQQFFNRNQQYLPYQGIHV